MGNYNEENSISLISVTTVDHSAAAQTTLTTVPTGYRMVVDHVKIVAAGDEAATDITLGQVGALTDFIGTTQLDNLDAQYDAVKVQPIQADPPVKQKSYAAGTVFQVDVTAGNGNAANTYYLFGTLYEA
jgi:hypothetical protein